MKTKVLFLFLSLFVFDSSFSNDKLFGYWAANGVLNQTSNHTNTSIIWAGTWPDLQAASNIIVNEALTADALGIKVIPIIDSFLFDWDQPQGGATGLSHCPFTMETQASANFQDLVLDLIQAGALIPNDPVNSVVSAFLVVDEPEECGLKDQSGTTHPALGNAISVVRNTSQTSNFPVMISTGPDYQQSIKGLLDADWVGYFNYGANTPSFLNSANSLRNQLTPGHKVLLIPQASTGGFMSSFGAAHNPDQVFNHFVDFSFDGIIPFLWDVSGANGVKNIPELRTAYENYGEQIKLDSIISASVSCFQPALNNYNCFAAGSGGNGSYSFVWSSPCFGTGNSATCSIQSQCSFGATAVPTSVAVFDAQGNYSVASESLICSGDAFDQVVD